MNPYLLILTAFFCFGCMDAIMKDELHAERNTINWTHLRVGMTKKEVLKIMGLAEKKEKYVVDDQRYEVWYYLTNSYKELVAKTYADRNYTPLIFEGRELKGWGYDNFYSLLKVSSNRERSKEQVLTPSEEYVEKKEDWPKEDHSLMLPPSKPAPQNESSPENNEAKIKEAEKELEDTLQAPESTKSASKPTKQIPEPTTPDEEENYIWE